MAVNGTQQFTATVTGTSNTQVTWSLSGAGCTGAACGTITAGGLYTAPGAIPNPATVTVTARSVADPNRSGTATVTIIASAAPLITTLRPTSARSGQAGGLLLRLVGQNFLTGTSAVFDGSQRVANCPTATECTLELSAADLALARTVTVQARQPDGTLSNTVNFVIVAPDLSEGILELTSAAPTADAGELAVLDPSNQGDTSAPPPQLNITHIGIAPSSSSCGSVRGGPVMLQRPGVGVTNVFICLAGAGLAAGHNFRLSGPEPNDILLTNPTQAGERVVVTLTISSATQPGPRTIFVTNARGDTAATAGGIEILP